MDDVPLQGGECTCCPPARRKSGGSVRYEYESVALRKREREPRGAAAQLTNEASPFAREIFDNEMTDPIFSSTPIANHFFFGRFGGVGEMPRVYILRRFPSCHCYIGQNHPILISSNHAMLAEQFGREGGAGGRAVWSKTALGWLDYDATGGGARCARSLRKEKDCEERAGECDTNQ